MAYQCARPRHVTGIGLRREDAIAEPVGQHGFRFLRMAGEDRPWCVILVVALQQGKMVCVIFFEADGRGLEMLEFTKESLNGVAFLGMTRVDDALRLIEETIRWIEASGRLFCSLG